MALPGQSDDLDDQGCVDDYPEHDYELFDEAGGLHCRRCGAEYIEDEDSNPL